MRFPAAAMLALDVVGISSDANLDQDSVEAEIAVEIRRFFMLSVMSSA